MKPVIKHIASVMVFVHAMSIPVSSSQLLAAPPFDTSPSRTTSNAVIPSSIGLESTGTTIHTTPYFTDSYGNILMNVNVWGNAVHTGPLTVPEGSNLSTVISLAGGPAKGANLEKVRINRAQPDRDGNMTYLVNLKSYAKAGDRSMMLDIQPNDTVIIPENKSIDAGFILGILAVGVSIYSINN